MRRLEGGSQITARRSRELGFFLPLIGIAVVSFLEARPVAGQTRASTSAQSLARYIPDRDLAIYWEFEGLDAHAPAWQGTAAYKLLNETK
jgi:hypothetical protein